MKCLIWTVVCPLMVLNGGANRANEFTAPPCI